MYDLIGVLAWPETIAKCVITIAIKVVVKISKMEQTLKKLKYNILSIRLVSIPKSNSAVAVIVTIMAELVRFPGYQVFQIEQNIYGTFMSKCGPYNIVKHVQLKY